MQVNHNQSLESPSPTTAPFASATVQSTSRRRLAATPVHNSPEHAAPITAAALADMPGPHVVMANLMMDAPQDSTTRKLRPGSRSLATADEVAVSADLWFGYDVHCRPQPVQRNSGNFTPRYVGLRNQVLGGLYFQQVRD